jgi:hypothetical protein
MHKLQQQLSLLIIDYRTIDQFAFSVRIRHGIDHAQL